MENKKYVNVYCPLHPAELIQRVNLSIEDTQHLYCTECILRLDQNSVSSGLKSIQEVVEMAAKYYQFKKQTAKASSKISIDGLGVLTNQDKVLDELSKHIEEEKKKVEHVFSVITESFSRIIEEKKNEYLHILDQQLFNLRYRFIFFDKQYNKAYPKQEDFEYLFPSKDELLKRLEAIKDITQLMIFTRSIKEDLNEQKMIISTDTQSYLDMLAQELDTTQHKKPAFKTQDAEIITLKAEIQETLRNTLNKLLILEDPIKDVLKGKDYESLIATSQDFALLKDWLPSNIEFNPKLLYRSSRDRLTSQAFHDCCDGKGATITLIKCQFTGSSKISVIGGFLDKNWEQKGRYIISENAFIFSLTKKIKCAISSQAYSCAAYGSDSQGPCFGGGHDIGTLVFGSQNIMNPNSYEYADKLIDTPNYTQGPANFNIIEIEVYSVS